MKNDNPVDQPVRELTRAEEQIMQILWDLEKAMVNIMK